MNRRLLSSIGTYLVLSLFVGFALVPVLWLISTAFKSPQELAVLYPAWIPRDPTLENFVFAFERQPLVRSSIISFAVATASSIVTVLVTLPAAYALARRGSGAFGKGAMVWILLSQLVPFIVISVPSFIIMVRVGLYNNLAGLVLIYVVWNIPFALWMLNNYVKSIPVELEEAAALDGANTLQMIRHVLFPLLAPGLVAATMFAFIGAWNEFFFALVLIQDPNLQPLSLMLVKFIGNAGIVRLGPLAAASLLAIIPSVLVFMALQRRIVSGLLGGAVRG